ncbi:MAG: Asp23/Gls24 family envelope stress response protein, partial [Dialister sp.]|nr:Asp23/Gls24 family envelope stress response protein [Dialister sp.]
VFMEAAKIKNDLGTISIADQVIAVFAREAALDTTGIIGMDDRYSHGISSVISDEDAEGVRVSVKENLVSLNLYVCVEYGGRIPEIALQLQKSVKENIYSHTEITVSEVNVNIEQIIFP